MWVTITPLTRSWTSKACQWLSCPIQGAPTFLHPGWPCCFPMSSVTGFAAIIASLEGLQKSTQKSPFSRLPHMCPQVASPKCFPTVSSTCWLRLGCPLFLTDSKVSPTRVVFTVVHIDPLCLLTQMSCGTTTSYKKEKFEFIEMYSLVGRMPLQATHHHPCIMHSAASYRKPTQSGFKIIKCNI